MNEELVAALARALGMPLSAEHAAEVARQLEGQVAGHGGLPAEELEGIEPAILFEPTWPE